MTAAVEDALRRTLENLRAAHQRVRSERANLPPAVYGPLDKALSHAIAAYSETLASTVPHLVQRPEGRPAPAQESTRTAAEGRPAK